ncbi:hypothetical protein Y032_0723g1841 [Ancylostoma ceylanicum]|uniref:Uncharacterized protein n=1 Tax=Ancylostoma ceylanicum TaxID=53326 RepID=A0A016WFF4_9BILA|nr:hypothetical protein Y032_0723g1841 [Ancylostoma ceylanicum]
MIIFSPMSGGPVRQRSGAWLSIMTAVSEGADLYCLTSPRDDTNWGFGTDLLRDLCEETIIQRPSLERRIHILLPYSDQNYGDTVPFITLSIRRANIPHYYTPSAAKRFLDATKRYYATHLRFEPYQRDPETKRRNGDSREGGEAEQQNRARNDHRELWNSGRGAAHRAGMRGRSSVTVPQGRVRQRQR